MSSELITMLEDIETAIEQRLTAKGLDVHEFNIQDDPDKVIKTPAANIAFWDGRLERITMPNIGGKFRMHADFHVVLLFKGLKSEKQRRRGVYPLLMSVIQYLAGRVLGLTESQQTRELSMKPLIPGRVRKVLDRDGFIAFSVVFATSFLVTIADDDDAGDLLKVALQYFLQPDDGEKDAEDIIDLS